MKKLLVFLFGFFIFLSCNHVALAADSPKIEGKPSAFVAGHSSGYFIWQDKDGLHLRTTTAGEKHIFSGSIHTDGKFQDVLESSQDTTNDFTIAPERNTIDFKFTTTGNVDSIDLNAHKATYVRFTLSTDNVNADPSTIFIGSTNWHPNNFKFTISQDDDSLEMGDNNAAVVIVDRPFWGWNDYYAGFYGPRHWHDR